MLEHRPTTTAYLDGNGYGSPDDDVAWEAAFVALLREPFRPVPVPYPAGLAARYEQTELEVAEWLQEAEDEAADILRRAREEAETIRRAAVADAEAVRRRAERDHDRMAREGQADAARAQAVLEAVQADVDRLRHHLSAVVEQAAAAQRRPTERPRRLLRIGRRRGRRS